MMRTILFTLAAAASAFAVASPASAQYYPQPQHPQGQAWGYHGNYGQVRSLQARIDHLQRRIVQLDRRHFLNDREARRLRQDSRDIEQRLRRAARNGLNPREHALIAQRIQRLEYRIFRDANDRNRWARHGYNDHNWNPDRFDDRRERDDDRGRGRDRR